MLITIEVSRTELDPPSTQSYWTCRLRERNIARPRCDLTRMPVYSGAFHMIEDARNFPPPTLPDPLVTDIDNVAVPGVVDPPAASPAPATGPRVIYWARAVRNRARLLVDRALHGRRRRKAGSMLSRTPPDSCALFLCHGNICRSSFAEYAFRQLAERQPRQFIVSSAGFVGPGRQPPQYALSSASRRGLDMSGHRSRVLTQEMLDASDIVVVMSADQARLVRRRMKYGVLVVLGDLDPEPIRQRTIHDPWRQDESVFDQSYDRIHRCLVEMIRAMVPVPPSGAT